MSTLFHRDIHMPANVANLTRRLCKLNPTMHAIKAAREDRYGQLDIPDSIYFSGSDVVEAEFEGKNVIKLVVRIGYDDRRDAIYAIGIDGRGNPFLKTVWFNLKSDKHKTLDRSKYCAK